MGWASSCGSATPRRATATRRSTTGCCCWSRRWAPSLLSAVAAQRGPRSWRAAWYGVSAGICFALTAAFIKTVANEWPHGIVYVFEHPAAYSVALVGLVGLVIAQHALDAGPVAASQAALLIVNPLSSIVMGIWLFRDHVHATGSRAIGEGLFLGLMFYSLLLLSQSPLISSTFEAEQLSDRNSSSQDARRWVHRLTARRYARRSGCGDEVIA